MIIILTGQPHSGKTTISNHLINILSYVNPNRKVFQVDGDDLRAITSNKDYSEQGRRKNIETAHAIAKYLQKQSELNDIIISLVSPFRDLREQLKSEHNCVEFFVHTTQIRGREEFHVSDYQQPLENFIDIDTTEHDELTTMNEILEALNFKYFK
jgi:adenylylsulfate kinase